MRAGVVKLQSGSLENGMTIVDLKNFLLQLATGNLERGPGFAQDSVVISDAVEQLRIGNDLAAQQELLTAWHDLFRDGILSWGYNADNPGAPFFHRTNRPAAA